MQRLWQDLRYGARMLLKQKSITAIAVLTLALGISANTAIFSVVDALLLRPLPYADSDRLVMLSVNDVDGKVRQHRLRDIRGLAGTRSVFRANGVDPFGGWRSRFVNTRVYLSCHHPVTATATEDEADFADSFDRRLRGPDCADHGGSAPGGHCQGFDAHVPIARYADEPVQRAWCEHCRGRWRPDRVGARFRRENSGHDSSCSWMCWESRFPS